MAIATVKLIAPPGSGVGGVIQTQFSGNVTTAADGSVNVNPQDVAALLAMGFSYACNEFRWLEISKAPAAASNAASVASAALSNGTLTIAAQPDYPRPLQAVVLPGTLAITAGVLTLTYTANDGTTQVDALSMVASASTNVTLNTSKGVVHLTSAVVSGLVGGASPTRMIGTTASLALPVAPGFQNFVVVKENDNGADAAIGAQNAAGALITPTAAPNGTNVYGFGYTFTMT